MVSKAKEDSIIGMAILKVHLYITYVNSNNYEN